MKRPVLKLEMVQTEWCEPWWYWWFPAIFLRSHIDDFLQYSFIVHECVEETTVLRPCIVLFVSYLDPHHLKLRFTGARCCTVVSAGCHERPRACRLRNTDILIPNCVPLSFYCLCPCTYVRFDFVSRPFNSVIMLFISVQQLSLLYAGSYTAIPVSTIDIKLRNSAMFFISSSCVQNNVIVWACKSICLRIPFHRPISGMGLLNLNSCVRHNLPETVYSVQGSWVIMAHSVRRNHWNWT